jgi:hypothetical protein
MLRRNGAGDPCNCLTEAFRQLRCGYSGRIEISCCSHDCPLNEVKTSVLDSFLKLIVTAVDEPEMSSALFSHRKVLR